MLPSLQRSFACGANTGKLAEGQVLSKCLSPNRQFVDHTVPSGVFLLAQTVGELSKLEAEQATLAQVGPRTTMDLEEVKRQYKQVHPEVSNAGVIHPSQRSYTCFTWVTDHLLRVSC